MDALTLKTRAAAFAARIGVGGLVIALLMAALAIQTIRLEGLRIWPVSVTGWKEKAIDRQLVIDQLIEAQTIATERAEQARQAQADTYRDIAERIDDNAQDSLGSAMDAADRFIAAGGMRAEATGHPARCPASPAGNHRAEDTEGTGSPAQLDAPDLGEGPAAGRAEGLVLVSPADIRICTENTVKAEAGRDLALQLEAESAAAAAAAAVK